MSFKDVKRKAMMDASDVSALSLVDEGIAVYDENNYDAVSGYKQYPQYIDNKYSTVNENKDITMDESQINITQETNSQYIPFRIPRYSDGIDLAGESMTISVRCSNQLVNGNPVDYAVINVMKNEQYITFGWLIDGKITASPGDYIFEIRATGMVDDLTYVWSTKPNGTVHILQGINSGDFVKPSDDSWMTKFEERASNYVKEASESAKTASNAAASVKENVDNIKDSVIVEVRNEFNNTDSLENYYTKSEINTKETTINSSLDAIRESINNIDGLVNLDMSYAKDTQTLSLLYKDSKKEITHAVINIDSLSKLRAKYTTSDGKGILSFYQEGLETPITSVELGSIDPSAEWVTTNLTPINNNIQSIQNKQTEDDQKITDLTSSLDGVKKSDTARDSKIKANENAIGELKTSVAEIPQLKEDVSLATNTVNNMKQTVDGNKQAVDTLGTSFDTLKGRVDELEKHPASTEYDVDYANNIFYWKENGETVKTFTIQGGGGGGTTTSTMTIERITPADAIFLLGNKAVIEYTWSSVDNVGD